MAEVYTKGQHRLFYRSTRFTPGLVVMVDLLFKDLTPILYHENLTEVGEGLYYFDCSFTLSGTYVGVFYENGLKVSTQNFLVTIERGIRGNIL